MRKLLFIFIAFFFGGCEFEHSHHNPYDPYPSGSYVTYQYAEPPSDLYYSHSACWGEQDPYRIYPEYCDSYCCTWYTGYGCYEEWCYWDGICGWEYYDSWCY